MNVLVIGNGAREHALVWKLSQSPKVDEVFVAPGNAGTGTIATNLAVSPTDLAGLLEAAQQHNVSLTVVGPEAPLAMGIVDRFQQRGLAIFGPTRMAAQIESSKVFAKQLMQKYNIPCARDEVFSSFAEAKDYVLQQEPPIVIKADGLAAGKGAIIAETHDEAIAALTDIMDRRVFGSAGDNVIVEEYLKGREVSLIAFTDGNTVVPMISACDYKRAFDNDRGPNTGGMGSYSPPTFFGEAEMMVVEHMILGPVISAMATEGMPYKGVLYAGLMLTAEGIKVLEFNVRFGDPETQVLLPQLETDLMDIMIGVVNGTLHDIDVKWREGGCVGVVLASGGYPGKYETGFPIDGLSKLDKDVMAFHAGTKIGSDGSVLTDGGRVLTVVGCSETVSEAAAKVYSNVPRINFEGCYCRSDIGIGIDMDM